MIDISDRTDSYHVTLWKRRDGYAEMLLSNGLGGEEKRLPHDIELGVDNEIVTFMMGDLAVRLSLVPRTKDITNSGIPFRGDIIAAELDMTAREMSSIPLGMIIETKLNELFIEDETKVA